MPELSAPPLPELDAHVARLGDALLERLRGNDVFRGWATGGIEAFDVEDLLLGTTFHPPAIALLLAGFDVVPDGSGRQTRLETLWEALFVRGSSAELAGAERWLSARLALHLWTELETTLGVLYGPPTGLYPDGEPLTQPTAGRAALRMQRTPAVRLLAGGLVAQPVRFLLNSVLDARTGRPYDE